VFVLAISLAYLSLGTPIIAAADPGEEKGTNKFVHVDAAVSESILKPGEQAELHLTFTPAEGIHVTIDPPVEIRVEPKRTFLLNGESKRPVDKNSGYLSSTEPVVQRFSLSRKAQPGKHVLRASIVYYFCSDDEGWCRKFSMPIELNLTVKK
jgi:hypothetical protein